MIQARRIGHATFETPDLDRAIDYYTQVNGLVLAEREENRAFLASKIGQLVVRLDRGASAQCTGLSFEVGPNSDFADMCRQLSDQGIANELSNNFDSGYRQSPEVQGPERHDHRAVLGMELSRGVSTR